ncbi:hypothetical protein BH24ACT12_BH24ACT12_04440 [soil metagenome]
MQPAQQPGHRYAFRVIGERSRTAVGLDPGRERYQVLVIEDGDELGRPRQHRRHHEAEAVASEFACALVRAPASRPHVERVHGGEPTLADTVAAYRPVMRSCVDRQMLGAVGVEIPVGTYSLDDELRRHPGRFVQHTHTVDESNSRTDGTKVTDARDQTHGSALGEGGDELGHGAPASGVERHLLAHVQTRP